MTAIILLAVLCAFVGYTLCACSEEDNFDFEEEE